MAYTVGRATALAINEVYKDILENGKKRMDEAITSSNSIHDHVEKTMKDFAAELTSSVDAEATEEKLKDLEKGELTNLDKKVIAAIRKLVASTGKALEDFKKFEKDLKYEFIVKKKDEPTGEDEVDENASEEPATGDSEEQLEAGADQFNNEDEEVVKAESFTTKSIYDMLSEKSCKDPKQCKEEIKEIKSEIKDLTKALKKAEGKEKTKIEKQIEKLEKKLEKLECCK